MKLQIKVEDGVIIDSKFKTFTSSSLATEWIKGKTLEEAAELLDILNCIVQC